MPQIFHVLRCFSCSTFQVHQVNKSKKYNCKMCGAKQSINKVFGQGSGAECRNMVQQLNMYQGEKEAEIVQSVVSRIATESEEAGAAFEQQDGLDHDDHPETPQNSKWSKCNTEDESPAQPLEEDNHNFTTSWGEFAGSRGKAGKNRGARRQPYARQNRTTNTSSLGRNYDDSFDSGSGQRMSGGGPLTRRDQSRLNHRTGSARIDDSRFPSQQKVSAPSENETKQGNFLSAPRNVNTDKKNVDCVSYSSVNPWRCLYNTTVNPSFGASHFASNPSEKHCLNAERVLKMLAESSEAVDKKKVTNTVRVSSSSKWSKYANVVEEKSCDSEDEDIDSAPFDNDLVVSQLDTVPKLPGHCEDSGSDPYASSQNSGDVLGGAHGVSRTGQNFEKPLEDASGLNSRKTGEKMTVRDSEIHVAGGASRPSKWGKFLTAATAVELDESVGDNIDLVLKESSNNINSSELKCDGPNKIVNSSGLYLAGGGTKSVKQDVPFSNSIFDGLEDDDDLDQFLADHI